MQRILQGPLKQWLYSPERKPLVLRGARQVGKTWLVRSLAQSENKKLIELNFEKNPQLKGLFNSTSPHQIVLNLEAAYNQTILPTETLLFFDEIQAAPGLLGQLRWFAEELPEFPIVAAGSLLEFVLASHTFSMPVGRISYMHVEPLSFEEFLLAQDKKGLYDFIQAYPLATEIPLVIHHQLMELFKEYVMIGGMPAATDSWCQHRNLEQISQLHHDLLATYRDDFSKYAGKMVLARLEEILRAIPRMLGEKFIYSHVNKERSSSTVKNALDLLTKARLCHKVTSCHANGIPLGAEIRDHYFKMLFLDVGLVSAMLGLNLSQINAVSDINLVNPGGISEQVVGQLLRTLEPFYVEPQLYYWTRDVKGSAAEVDYIIQYQGRVIPLEVKSGSTGSLKSLHLFMNLKQLSVALRVNSDLPTVTPINTQLHNGEATQYRLISIPFYLLGQVHRLLST